MKKQLQALLDRSRFLRPYGFRVVVANKEKCTLELPHRASLERPGGIINGPALMAAADCAMWLAIKANIGIEQDALTSELDTAFLAPAPTGPRVGARVTVAPASVEVDANVDANVGVDVRSGKINGNVRGNVDVKAGIGIR